MSYDKTIWVDGDTPLSSTNLNKIEQGIEDAHNNKLDASTYTANDILTKIKTVDGAGSELDADKLDGNANAGKPRLGNTNFPNPKIIANCVKATKAYTNILLIKTNEKLEGIVCRRMKLPLDLSFTIFPPREITIKNMAKIDHAGTLCCVELGIISCSLEFADICSMV